MSEQKPPAHRPREPIVHGTWHGYKKHRRRGETACPSCKEAWRKYQLGRRNTGTHLPPVSL